MDKDEGGPIILDGKEQVRAGRIIAVASGLALKVNTGMNPNKGKPIGQIVRAELGSRTKSLAKLLAEYVEYAHDEIGYVPRSVVSKALGDYKFVDRRIDIMLAWDEIDHDDPTQDLMVMVPDPRLGDDDVVWAGPMMVPAIVTDLTELTVITDEGATAGYVADIYYPEPIVKARYGRVFVPSSMTVVKART